MRFALLRFGGEKRRILCPIPSLLLAQHCSRTRDSAEETSQQAFLLDAAAAGEGHMWSARASGSGREGGGLQRWCNEYQLRLLPAQRTWIGKTRICTPQMSRRDQRFCHLKSPATTTVHTETGELVERHVTSTFGVCRAVGLGDGLVFSVANLLLP